MQGVSAPDSYDKFLVLWDVYGQSLGDGNIFATYRDIVKTCISGPKVIPTA